jgi:hypothetical protein
MSEMGKIMKWIKVEEELPEEGQTVICYCLTIVLGYHIRNKLPQEEHVKGWNRDWPNDHGMLKDTFERFPVTHWMRLPEFPC